MASRALDAEIDRLYQLPLEEFTTARNDLAKSAGTDAKRIRALAKPPIAAWAVNQLYWNNSDLWNALIAAGENAQRAHRAVLAGKSADVRAAGKVHEDAVEKALRATLTLLGKAGHPAADATKHAIGTTLRALPGDEAAGRFTRTLQPAGFGMLTGLQVSPKAPSQFPKARRPTPKSQRPTPKSQRPTPESQRPTPKSQRPTPEDLPRPGSQLTRRKGTQSSNHRRQGADARAAGRRRSGADPARCRECGSTG